MANKGFNYTEPSNYFSPEAMKIFGIKAGKKEEKTTRKDGAKEEKPSAKSGKK